MALQPVRKRTSGQIVLLDPRDFDPGVYAALDEPDTPSPRETPVQDQPDTDVLTDAQDGISVVDAAETAEAVTTAGNKLRKSLKK